MSIKNEKRPRDGWGSTVHLGLKGTCYHSRFKGGVRADNKSHIISTISSSHLTVITSAALGAIFWPKIQEPCDRSVSLSHSLSILSGCTARVRSHCREGLRALERVRMRGRVCVCVRVLCRYVNCQFMSLELRKWYMYLVDLSLAQSDRSHLVFLRTEHSSAVGSLHRAIVGSLEPAHVL
jgi:hypothetical protein